MKKITAYAGIGFSGAEFEETFEFEDGITEKEIEDEIYCWAEDTIISNLTVNWEEEEEEEE